MYKNSSALASYGRVANSEADPLQQVVMLYDGAMKFLRLAADDIDARNIPGKAEHVNRALDIINYLQSILDFDRGLEVAQVLDNLYTLVSMNILRASAKLDAQAMREAAGLLEPVRGSWHQISQSSSDHGLVPIPVGAQHQRLGRLVMA